MRTLPSTLFAAAIAVSCLEAGCQWTDFDDIESTTWAVSVSKPSAVGSSDWGYGLVSSKSQFMAIGRSDSSIAVMHANANGSFTVDNTLSNKQVDTDGKPRPITASSSDGLATAAVAGNNVQVWKTNQFAEIIPTSPQINAIALRQDGTAIVGADSTLSLLGTGVVCPTSKVIAASDFGDGTIVWSSTGAVDIYKFSAPPAQSDCAAKTAGDSTVVNASDPKPTDGIISIINNGTGTFAVLAEVGVGATGSMTIIDLRTGANFGKKITSKSAAGLSSLASGTLTVNGGSKDVIVAGFKNEVIDGNPSAGQVKFYFFDGTAISEQGFIHDASPTAEQNFGRSVAITELGGKPVILVGADDEIFAYFQTALFADSRTK
jgi:hypothetical protein